MSSQLSGITNLADLIASRAVAGKPTELRTLLTLYVRAKPADVYCNYFKGFKLLYEWLAPISIPDLPEQKLPPLCGSYELQEIARIVGISQARLYAVILSMEDVWT
jgi:hypothetical protein